MVKRSFHCAGVSAELGAHSLLLTKTHFAGIFEALEATMLQEACISELASPIVFQ